MRRHRVRLLAMKQHLTRHYATGAGDENRTRMTSLEGWGSTIELHPHVHDVLRPEGVRLRSWSRGDRTRTCDLLLPKQTR
jgi:hypothetical protein